MANRILLRPGTLRSAATETTVRARCCGALQPIATTCEFVEDHDVRFLVRILTQQRAPKPRRDPTLEEAVRRNPFLPYDPNLFVADVSPTHVCLLNKFTVIDNHLLVVTRTYEHQDEWLTLQDFEALCVCMAEFEGLGFYNAGMAAGASQPHKHLQYVPYPMASSGRNIPLEAKLASGRVGRLETALDLPFDHAFIPFAAGSWRDWRRQARQLFELYGVMLAATGIAPQDIAVGARQTCAYNLLVTRDWLLIVPRCQDAANGISVNGLGFAGHLLARDREQADYIAKIGPLNILKQVAIQRPRP